MKSIATYASMFAEMIYSYNNKRMKTNSQLGLYRRQRKDTYCRPISAFFLSRSRTSQTEQLFNSLHSRSKDSQSCTTRQRSTQRPLYRSLRSATTESNIQPHPTQKRWKLQILNSACLKKIYQPTIQSKGNSVFNVNEVLSRHIVCPSKENAKKYHCKKLKIMRGKLKVSSSMYHGQDEEYASFNAGVVGSKLL